MSTPKAASVSCETTGFTAAHLEARGYPEAQQLSLTTFLWRLLMLLALLFVLELELFESWDTTAGCVAVFVSCAVCVSFGFVASKAEDLSE